MCPWRVFTTETFWQPFCIHWYNLFSRSTLISRFSWALVSKIASEKRKSGKNWPVPYAKTIFSFFTAFFAEALLRVYELFVYTLQLPEHHVVWLKDPFEVNSFVSPVHWWVQVNYIYSWSDPANLRNREKRGLRVYLNYRYQYLCYVLLCNLKLSRLLSAIKLCLATISVALETSVCLPCNHRLRLVARKSLTL